MGRLDQRPPVDVCQTCGSGQGYIWPGAQDGDTEHQYVMRCDMCERFTSDDAAAVFLHDMLGAEGHAVEIGHKFIAGDDRPYIDFALEEANA